MNSPDWIREALQAYFVKRPGIQVDTVDLMGYFHVASVLDAAEDLVASGWLTRTDGIYPKLKQTLPTPAYNDRQLRPKST